MSLGLPDFTIIIQFFLFFGTLMVLNFWVFTPLLKVIEERRHKTVVTLKEADKLTKQAGQVLHEYETKLKAHRVILHERVEKTHSELNREFALEAGKTKDVLQKNLKEHQKTLADEALKTKKELDLELKAVSFNIVQKLLGEELA